VCWPRSGSVRTWVGLFKFCCAVAHRTRVNSFFPCVACINQVTTPEVQYAQQGAHRHGYYFKQPLRVAPYLYDLACVRRLHLHFVIESPTDDEPLGYAVLPLKHYLKPKVGDGTAFRADVFKDGFRVGLVR